MNTDGKMKKIKIAITQEIRGLEDIMIKTKNQVKR